MAAQNVTGLAEVLRNLDAFEQTMLGNVMAAADEIAALLESHAKTNHLWKPVTGATDVSTVGQISEVTREYVMVALSAGMEYDVFLELAMGQRWSWLWPSVTANQSNIVSILERHCRL